MATARAVLGGLLSGLGEGVVDHVKQLRLEGLERARQLREDERTREQRQFQRERDAAARQFTLERDRAQADQQRGQLSSTMVGEGGQVYGITRSGETRDLGIRAPREETDAGSFSPDDKRLWDAVAGRHTTRSYEGDTTDWSAVAAEFQRMRRPDLAQLAQPAGGGTTDTNSKEWLAAEEMATQQADERDPIGINRMRRKATEEAYDGMTRSEWIERRTQEIYQQRTGQSGSGSRDSATGAQATPHRPTTQSDFDAIPGGAVYIDPEDGRTYRKYESAEAVRQAYSNGSLTRQQALRILREQFGME